jgi:hypothetical protein
MNRSRPICTPWSGHCVFWKQVDLIRFFILWIPLSLSWACPHVRGAESNKKEKESILPVHMEKIGVHATGSHFVEMNSGKRFTAWGFNYDHDRSGRLIEDYWCEEWSTVEEDFREMKSLGANVVRLHLQVATFLEAPQRPDVTALKQLERVVKLAETTGLYLDITGLGCYHRRDVPPWYEAMAEGERWETQALFWQAVAETCAGSPAVFCYDLMNEPILPGRDKAETDWLAGEFGGKHFVQRLTLDLAGRTRERVAQAWVDRMVKAIRAHDQLTLITLGVIPWAHVFPGAKPLFYSQDVARHLDFVSVHFYPKRGEVDKAVTALAVYDVGKPLVVEEMFPLHCSTDELEIFVNASRSVCDGWIGFYWGQSLDELDRDNLDIGEMLTRDWLRYFRSKTPAMTGEPVIPKIQSRLLP